MIFKYLHFLIIFLVLFSGSRQYVLAQENGIVISPQIIDEKVMARDILERKIKIKYDSKAGPKLSVYAVVYDFDEKNGNVKYEGPGSANKENSIASWVSLKRGANELMPGESLELPLTIKVNFNALPGKYYAIIYYVSAHDGYEAENNSRSGAWPKTNINLEVTENKVEKAQITKFKTTSNLYLDGKADLILRIKNNGNSDIVPGGYIRIYDRRGEEVKEIPINTDKKSLAVSDESEYGIEWIAAGQVGKFKALADLSYGAENDKNFQDTIFFWVIPKKILIIFGICVGILIILLILIIFRRNKLTVEMQGGKNQPEKIINLKI